MKKTIFCVIAMILATTVISSAQVVIPQSSKTVSFQTFKTDAAYTAIYKEAMAFANAGKKLSEVTFASGVTIEEVWDVTEVPSRSGNKETQQLLVYKEAGVTKYALVNKDHTTVTGSTIKTQRGDGLTKYK